MNTEVKSTLQKVFPGQQHVAVIDSANGLMWAADDVTTDPVDFAGAEQACRDLRLLGHDDWRLPTIQELLTCIDYSRCEPATDPELHRVKNAWYWTGTPTAWSASARWVVSFSGGLSYGYDIGYRARVRAVRSVRAVSAGQ